MIYVISFLLAFTQFFSLYCGIYTNFSDVTLPAVNGGIISMHQLSDNNLVAVLVNQELSTISFAKNRSNRNCT